MKICFQHTLQKKKPGRLSGERHKTKTSPQRQPRIPKPQGQSWRGGWARLAPPSFRCGSEEAGGDVEAGDVLSRPHSPDPPPPRHSLVPSAVRGVAPSTGNPWRRRRDTLASLITTGQSDAPSPRAAPLTPSLLVIVFFVVIGSEPAALNRTHLGRCSFPEIGFRRVLPALPGAVA